MISLKQRFSSLFGALSEEACQKSFAKAGDSLDDNAPCRPSEEGSRIALPIKTARRCLDAGAKFLTSPGLDIEVVELAVKHDVVVFPGALIPTDIMAAWKAGSDFVKVFPCALLGGASYIRTLKISFPHMRLIASGGVTQGNAADFILAGAAGLGIGRDLINPEAIQRRELDWIRELAGRFLQILQDARSKRVM